MESVTDPPDEPSGGLAGGLVADLRAGAAKLAGEDLFGCGDNDIESLLAGVYEVEAVLAAAKVNIIGEIEHRAIQQLDGHRTVGTYIAHELRLRKETVTATARLAHKRKLTPHTIAALEQGVISENHAQLLARAWNRKVAGHFDRDEPMLVAKAQVLSFQEFAYFIEHWSNIADPDRGSDSAEKAVRERRAYCARVGDRIHLDAVGDIVSGSVMKEALDAIEQELFEQDWAEARQRLDDPTPADLARNRVQRRYDALIELANRAMAAKPGGKRPEPLVNIVCDLDTFNQAVLELAGHEPTYELSGVCEMLDGTPIAPQQALEQALLGHVARVVFDADDQIINSGRSRRLYTKRMKTILAVRDRHCTWPGCDLPPTRCEVDHITEWQHGGETDIANSRLRCRYHHRLHRKPR